MNFFDHKDLEITSCSYALKSWNTLYMCVLGSELPSLKNAILTSH
jgi:hypothetical protein